MGLDWDVVEFSSFMLNFLSWVTSLHESVEFHPVAGFGRLMEKELEPMMVCDRMVEWALLQVLGGVLGVRWRRWGVCRVLVGFRAF
jgi:hypothetical protein